MKRSVCLAASILCMSGGAAFALDVAPAGAAACSGCHPVNRTADTQFTRLVGRNAGDIVAAMQEFSAGKRAATVMDRIAKGFTEGEVKAIAAWYAAQKD